MKKKVVFLLCLFFMGISLSACGINNDKGKDSLDAPSENVLNENNENNMETEQNSTDEKLTSEITVQSCENPQIGGAAYVCFAMKGRDYNGVMNSKGKIIYYTENPIEFTSVGNNYGLILENEIYGVINYESGKTTWFEEDQFDKVIGYGDDFILTYKSNSTISNSEHIYCVINAKTGKTVKQNTCSKELQHPGEMYRGVRHDYIHIGDGWFLSKADNRGVSEDSWLYDSNKNISYVLDKSISVIGDSFANGKIYMKTSSYTADILCRKFNGEGEYIDFPSSIQWHFLFDQKGYVEKVSQFTAGATGLNVVYEDVEYVKLIDTATEITYEYTEFPIEMVEHVAVYKDYCIVFIEGADHKSYFTLINKKGEQLFEPILYIDSKLGYSEVKLSEDRLIYQCKSKSSNMFDMCKIFDLKGNEIFIIDYIDSDEVVEFHNGILMNENKYIDKAGNELELTIKQ